MWETLTVMVVILATGFILFKLLDRTGETAIDAGDAQRCEASVRASAVQGLLAPSHVGELKCSTHYITVADKDETRQKAAIADAMRSCWSQFGQGRLPLFDVRSGSFCVVCARLEFSAPLKVTKFTQYLLEKPAAGTGGSYYQYLFGADPASAASLYPASAIASVDTLDTSRPLAVMFVTSKKVDDWTAYLVGGGVIVAGGAVAIISGGTLLPVVAAVGGGAAGYFTSPYFTNENAVSATVLWPYDDLGAMQCTRLEGKAGPLTFVT